MDSHLPSVQQETKMNKFFVVTLLAIVFAIALFEVNSLPLDDEMAPVGDEPHGRVTCDVIGSETLCAIRCIAMGHKGGYCEKGVCHCRD
ncbi:hypothetical protein Zmor_022044 [Zophobas morio]|uniref:Invertebrate defensins family profile domain-containing protein n=1 Tax=Zophobas morio TaxID=2755281 RepID=A0AA38I7I2_9CUCU|nr:hypothetical protein Zmor_022044 [Zophobas morio]